MVIITSKITLMNAPALDSAIMFTQCPFSSLIQFIEKGVHWKKMVKRKAIKKEPTKPIMPHAMNFVRREEDEEKISTYRKRIDILRVVVAVSQKKAAVNMDW